ncbi:lipid-A-disaccharide synthase [Candidatus Liberibacter asiaticus]|uniref:Lipid-A-disaccharide synthase n=3 Tax=Liberibacter asiaticus TaxID=34021 RepID=C6XFT7_LIBAP|nr:lipid-A-disaccharide synthase [Candidatus Liberibacter asiaticus]ACT57240.1 lipid-A-disaccharide synthase [Candidatus Liberibacter asiaticus str. psy62]AGH16797.1 lipid-A-disaccharide synthase [Candidatus Liberibacter asiaticus str. gxpsy]ALK07161.1 lipid-A-disaccharide synthase [Candidatus Liberibacter asiaticus]ASK52638.1 lipid-A-disaccharide synthase [Candidatus Liberibacter asiaticus]AWL13963.1 lipid-A-disaccharide synthase [Candidatus Liberibacter asiaticus]
MNSLKIAVIAGEISGDLLAGDLIKSLKEMVSYPINLVGVGGPSLQKEGLVSLFDFSELSVIGIMQVVRHLPQFIFRINQTVELIVSSKPDVLLIVDNPDFTHRVAKRVRKKMPNLPIINYVCPSVWAWREGRARKMCAYINQVISILPFEKEVMQRLGGPPTTFVGHPLSSSPSILEVYSQRNKQRNTPSQWKKILLLPGSRAQEIYKILPFFESAVASLVKRNPFFRFSLVTVSSQENLVRCIVSKWDISPEIIIDKEQKKQVFMTCNAAMAASGTVILELALCGIPVVSIYKSEWIVNFFIFYIKTWTCALPNLIVDYPLVPEYFNSMIRSEALVRWIERLSQDTLQRRAMLHGFENLWDRMNTKKPAGHMAAEIVLQVLG